MLYESRKKVINFIYERNEKIKLYIKIKKNVNKSDIDKSIKELDKGHNDCVKSNLNKYSAIKCFDDDLTSDNKMDTEIVDRLLGNYPENHSGCVISFNNYENLKTIRNNMEYEIKNNTNDIYLRNIIEHFFDKINELPVNKNENKIYTIRYGVFSFSNIYDLLEEYDSTQEYYKKIKRSIFKHEKEKICTSSYTDVQPKNELKKFNEKTKVIEFSDLAKLKDILNFAEKEKKSLEEKLKINESLFYSLIAIDIIEIKDDNLLKSPLNNKYVLGNFYFLNIPYFNYDDDKENIMKEELGKSFYEIINLIKYYLDGNLNIDISNFNLISKIVHEICYDLKIHLKIVLFFPYNYNNKVDESILNFIYSVDFKLKDYLHFFSNNLNKLESVNYNSKDNKDFVIQKNEKYYKVDRILFENIDLDENLKYYIIREALKLPEESFDFFALLNKTFQHNYSFYKGKEKEFHKNILNLVKKQNEIIKSYEEEENKKKEEINNLLKEIYYVNEKNLEIKNEIQRHQNLNLKYLQTEENNEVQNLKRLHAIDSMLDKEYEHFLNFRNESISNQGWVTKKEKNFQNLEDINTSKDILDIHEKQEEEYLKNLNEAIKFAEQNFQQTHNLKKKYDDLIYKKIELFNILKSTATKLNEKTNSLMNNFKTTQGLKFINPPDNNCINFKEKYKNNLTRNSLKEYNDLLEELKTKDFNENQIQWIQKMNSISKKF